MLAYVSSGSYPKGTTLRIYDRPKQINIQKEPDDHYSPNDTTLRIFGNYTSQSTDKYNKVHMKGVWTK